MHDLTTAIQQDCLSLLVESDEHGQIIAELVSPELFEGDYRLVAERAAAYWQREKSAPKAHMGNLLEDVFGNKDRRQQAKVLRSIIRQMRDTADRVNPAYVIGTLRGFVGQQRRKAAMLQMMERINANTSLDEVDEIYSEVMRADNNVDFDPGLQLTDISAVLRFLERRQDEFITGIKELDQVKVVPMRSAVTLWLAPTGYGKSWALSHTGYLALLARSRVLHITLELLAEEVLQRYYQLMFRASKRRLPRYPMVTLRKNKKGELTGLGDDTGGPEFTLNSPYILYELRDRMVEIPGNNLRVKKFPMRGLTIAGLRAYLDRLERFEKFIPDMILLDYIGIMQTDSRNHRVTLGRVMEDFKGLCDERNIAGVTAQQVNKLGARASVVNNIHVAEDWSLTNTADQVVAYSATPEERKENLARLYVCKARSEKDNFGVIVVQDYQTGQFVLESAWLNSFYTNEILPKLGGKDAESRELEGQQREPELRLNYEDSEDNED